MKKIEVGGYIRITKQEAKKRYSQGLRSYMLPCKASLLSPWVFPCVIVNGDVFIGNTADNIATDDFDSAVNEFEYYNCNAEMGRYTAFYKKGALL
jgi:hypothetical protein